MFWHRGHRTVKFPLGIFDSSNCKDTEQLSQRIIIFLPKGGCFSLEMSSSNAGYSIMSRTDEALAGVGGGGAIGSGILAGLCGFV